MVHIYTCRKNTHTQNKSIKKIACKTKDNGIWNHGQAAQSRDLLYFPLTHQLYPFPKALELSPPAEKVPGLCPSVGTATTGWWVLLCSMKHFILSWMLFLLSSLVPGLVLGLASMSQSIWLLVTRKGVCSLRGEMLGPVRTVGEESMQEQNKEARPCPF